MRNKLHDPSPGKGVFTGDLKYGRRNGRVITREDHTGEHNMPVAPLKLIRGRNPTYWTKDKALKKASGKTGNWQQAINYLLTTYADNINNLKANFHLTVGKQRL